MIGSKVLSKKEAILMKKETAYAHVIGAGTLNIFAKLLMIGKSNQARSSLEERRLRLGPKGKRRVEDIEF